MTVHIAIGNSDDRLTQIEWARYVEEADSVVRSWAQEVYGAWLSEPSSRYQNACWGFTLEEEEVEAFKRRLAKLARSHAQDSIAFNSSETEMIAATRDPVRTD